MSRSTVFQEDLQLHEMRLAEHKLRLLEKECAEIPKRLAQELKDRECTMPPLPEIRERELRREHEHQVSRGEITNIQRIQAKSMTLLILLLAATGSLIWWGVKLIQG